MIYTQSNDLSIRMPEQLRQSNPTPIARKVLTCFCLLGSRCILNLLPLNIDPLQFDEDTSGDLFFLFSKPRAMPAQIVPLLSVARILEGERGRSKKVVACRHSQQLILVIYRCPESRRKSTSSIACLILDHQIPSRIKGYLPQLYSSTMTAPTFLTPHLQIRICEDS